MKKLAILLLVTFLLAACGGMPKTPTPLGADAPANKVPSIIGQYALNGTDAAGEDYGGTLIVTAGTQPNEYQLQWIITGGVHEGVGTLTGNKLTVTWHSVDAGTGANLSGSASYTVTVNGELYGARLIEGVDKPNRETAYPNAK